MSRKSVFNVPLSSLMSQMYGYIYSMLVSNVLVGMPLFGGALYLCGRAATVLPGVFGRKNRRYLPRYARWWGILLGAVLLVTGVLLMGLYPAGFQSARVWVVFAAVALCLCADGMAARIRRLKRTTRKASRRAWTLTSLLQLILAAATGAVLLLNMKTRTALELTGAFALLILFRAYSAYHLYECDPEAEDEPENPPELLNARAFRSYEIISLLTVAALEMTVTADYALLATASESILPSLAIGVGCTLVACQASAVFLRRTRKPTRQDPTWLLCTGLILWLFGVAICSRMLRNGIVMMAWVYFSLAACSAGSTMCFAGLMKIDELIPSVAEVTGNSDARIVRKQREANLELAQLFGAVLSLLALCVFCFITGREVPRDLSMLAARFQPVMIVPLLLVISAALVSAFLFPLSARYIEKLRLFLRLKQNGEDNPVLQRKLERVVAESYRQPWLTRFLMMILRPVFHHKLVDTDHIRVDENNPLVFLGNHAEIYGPIVCALFFPVPARFWTISKMMGNTADVEAYLYENTFRHKTFLPVFVRKALAWILGWLSVRVMEQIESIPVYRDSPMKLRETVRISIEAMESGDNIVIFPENPDGKYQKGGIGEISPGFVMLAEAYWKKTGKKLRMMPMYASQERKTITFGQEIVYQPEKGFHSEQERIVAETREQILCLAETGRIDSGTGQGQEKGKETS